MKELSLNILDIVENSTKAGATCVSISLDEDAGKVLTLEITDDGCGMTDEVLSRVLDPFYTTRTTRRVGLGIPLLKLACEQTGGTLTVQSKAASQYPDAHGTVVTAVLHRDHIDAPPLGDVVSTVTTMVQGHPSCDFIYTHKSPARTVTLDTRALRAVLGPDIPLSEPEVLCWIRDSLTEQYGAANGSPLFLS